MQRAGHAAPRWRPRACSRRRPPALPLPGRHEPSRQPAQATLGAPFTSSRLASFTCGSSRNIGTIPRASMPRAQASRPLRLPVPITASPPATRRVRRRRPVCSPWRNGRHHTKPRPDWNGRRKPWPEATICAGVTRIPFSPRPRRPRAALKPVGIARYFAPLARISAPRSKASITFGTLVQTSPAGRSDWPERGNTCDRQALVIPRALPPKLLVTCRRSSALTCSVSPRIAVIAARSPARTSAASTWRRSPTMRAASLTARRRSAAGRYGGG
jgi:hypothetical protein